MWKYAKLSGRTSPMAEITANVSNVKDLRLVVYNLSENHVECATVSPNEVREMTLSYDTARAIANDARNGEHAILAFDMRHNKVFLIDSTPNLEVASAVLLCVVTELLNGEVQCRTSQCGTPKVRESRFNPSPRVVDEVVRRDERGRFVRKDCEEEPNAPCNEHWNGIPSCDGAEDVVMNRRFHIGRR